MHVALHDSDGTVTENCSEGSKVDTRLSHDPVIHKLRWNEPLTRADLDALEKILVEAGAGTPDDLSKVRSGSGLGLFMREMIGLDREAAKRAFDGFLTGKTLTAKQIQFVNLVVDYLTKSGWMSAAQLYESPFTDFSPKGVEGVFGPEQVLQMVGILNDIESEPQHDSQTVSAKVVLARRLDPRRKLLIRAPESSCANCFEKNCFRNEC